MSRLAALLLRRRSANEHRIAQATLAFRELALMKRSNQRRISFSYRHPAPSMIGRLPFEINVSSFIPIQNTVREIVQDNIAEIGANGENRVTLAIWSTQNRQQQI